MYCVFRKQNVYSCDHDICNNGSYRMQQGMKFCVVQQQQVYDCDHNECQ
jgi:hypothetical protein